MSLPGIGADGEGRVGARGVYNHVAVAMSEWPVWSTYRYSCHTVLPWLEKNNNDDNYNNKRLDLEVLIRRFSFNAVLDTSIIFRRQIF